MSFKVNTSQNCLYSKGVLLNASTQTIVKALWFTLVKKVKLIIKKDKRKAEFTLNNIKYFILFLILDFFFNNMTKKKKVYDDDMI
jgi:hypothetical protein